MGVDLCILFSHQLDDSNILKVPDLLNTNDLLAKATERYQTLRDHFTPWHWDVKPDGSVLTAQDIRDENQSIVIEGQAAWSIRFRRDLCNLHESRNWGLFVDNIEWQSITRAFCAALAQIFASPRAIYFPDSMYQTSLIGDRLYKNNSFDQIEEHALRDFGLPSAFLTPERAVWLQQLSVEKAMQASNQPSPTREEIFSGKRMRVHLEKLKHDRTHNVYFVDDFRDLKSSKISGSGVNHHG